MIAKALKVLNYKVYDYDAALSRAHRDFPLWVEAASLRNEAKAYTQSDYDKLIGDFNALAALPTAFFDREMIKLYPNAKFIMLSSESKYTALAGLIQNACFKVLTYMAPIVDPKRFGPVYTFLDLTKEHKLDAQHVRNTVSERNLLEISSFESWKPLCEFLKIQEPEIALERADDTITTKSIAKDMLPALLHCHVRLGIFGLSYAWAVVTQAAIALGPEIAIILACQRMWISCLLVLSITTYVIFEIDGPRALRKLSDTFKSTGTDHKTDNSQTSTVLVQPHISNGRNNFKRQRSNGDKNHRQIRTSRNRSTNLDRSGRFQPRQPDLPIAKGWADHQKVIMTKDLEDNKENKAQAEEMAGQRFTFNQVYRQMNRQVSGSKNVIAVMQETLD